MSEALRQVVWKCDRCGGDAQAIFGIFPSCKCGSTSFKAAQPPAPTAQPAPVNGIKATMFHDEGAIAQCQGCKRYSLDPNTLHQSDSKQPVCECGKQHYWSGSFVKPGPDAKWHGKAPAAQPVQQPGADVHWCATWLRNNYQDHPSISGLCDAMKEAAHQAAPAQRQPLSEAQIHAMKCAAADQGITGIAPSLHLARAVEAAHGITAAPAAQKGEKL